MGRRRLNGVVSTLLAICALLLAFTGGAMHFAKTGMVLGLPRYILLGAHFYTAAVMCILIIAHFISNFRLYRAELRVLRGKDNEPD